MKIQKRELLHADPLQAHQEQWNGGIVAANWQPTFKINQNKISSNVDIQKFNKPKKGSVPHYINLYKWIKMQGHMVTDADIEIQTTQNPYNGLYCTINK